MLTTLQLKLKLFKKVTFTYFSDYRNTNNMHNLKKYFHGIFIYKTVIISLKNHYNLKDKLGTL